jgi:hypothetical protein
MTTVPVEQLSWDFVQSFLGKHGWICFELVKRDELDDVCRCVAPKGL